MVARYGDELYTKRFETLARKHDPAAPLFVYLAYQCAHDPLQAPRRFLREYAAFAGTAEKDWRHYERNAAESEPAKRRAQSRGPSGIGLGETAGEDDDAAKMIERGRRPQVRSARDGLGR